MSLADRDVHTTPGGRRWTWVRASMTARRNLLVVVHVAGGDDLTLAIPARMATAEQVEEQVGLLVDVQRPPPAPTAL